MSSGQSGRSAVLFLPGLLCDHVIWSAQIAAVGTQRAIVVDDFYGEADSIEAMAEHALALAPDRFALAGHSMGARVALEIVRRAPERVERLAMISTGVHSPRAGEAKARFALLSLGLEQGIETMLDAWLPPMVWDANQRRPGLIDRLLVMCERAGIDTFERQIRALLGRPEVESLLPHIQCPTLVAVGRYDLWSPVIQHEQIAAAIPGAQLAVVEESGHMLPVEQAEQLNAALLQWLEPQKAAA